jgi:hypothetical protein
VTGPAARRQAPSPTNKKQAPPNTQYRPETILVVPHSSFEVMDDVHIHVFKFLFRNEAKLKAKTFCTEDHVLKKFWWRLFKPKTDFMKLLFGEHFDSILCLLKTKIVWLNLRAFTLFE